MNTITILVNDVYDDPKNAVYFKTAQFEELFALAADHISFVAYMRKFGKQAFVLQDTRTFPTALSDEQFIGKANVLLRVICSIMPVYVEIMLIQDHIEDNPNMDFTGFKNDNQIVKLPKLYGQTYRTFGHKEAALKRLLWFIKREYENQEHYVDEETFVLETIDNIGSNEYTCYLCYNETHPLEYCFDTNMTLSYQGIAQDIALVATDISIECLHENCTMMCITVYLPVDISSIRVGQMINYATFEHLETECALEMETLNNGAGIGKELFSFDRTQFDLKEDVVFMFCTTIKNTCSYKRIN